MDRLARKLLGLVLGLLALLGGPVLSAQTMVQHTGTLKSAVAPYPAIAGTAAPEYGSSGGAYPPSGWSGLFNSNADDASLSVSIPFTFYLAGTGYTTTYVGSNLSLIHI